MKAHLLRLIGGATLVAVAVTVPSSGPGVVHADTYQRISGSGSSWAANAIDAMRVNVKQFGITVDYNPNGSSAGRKDYLNGVVDFASSDIPFQFHPEDGSAPENPAPNSYAYIPVTAGGTAFMYNLKINGKRVTNLRLSGENVAKIFTGKITQWNDPAIAADNPGLTMPARAVVPVVRSDGSGSSAQFTLWMIKTHPEVWNDFCQRSGRAPACGFTSFYPTIQGMIAQQGDLGVAGYVSQGFAEGAIGYVNYSYALGAQFPVVKMLNAAGFYTEPTPQNVAVSLLKASINTDASDPTVYLTQNLDGVYADGDPRNYQLSSYSYLILPTVVQGQFTADKGKTLGAFAYYAMCEAQQQSASLGYSPMPINLVQASFDQIKKVPGTVVESIDITQCKNPTFSADGTNTLAKNAKQPKACDQQGTLQCPDGTAGLANVPTAVNAAAQGATATTVAAGGGGSTGGGGATATTAAAASGGGGGATQTPTATTVAVASGSGTPAAAGSGSSSGAGTGTKTTTPAKSGTGTKATTAPASGNGTKTTTAGGASAGSTTPAGGSSASEAPLPTSVAAAGDGQTTGTDPAQGAVQQSTDTTSQQGGGQQLADGQVAAADPAAAPAPAQATAIGEGSTSSKLGLTLVVIFLVIGVVMGPAIAWRHFKESTT